MAITKITGASIAADAIDGTKIADDAINSEHLAADSIDAEHYAAGSVDVTALGADAVTAAKIGDDVIDSEHYAATSVDDAHINDVAASKLTGTIATARLGSGTASSSTILYGDQTYKTEPAGFDPDAAVVFNESGADVDFRVESDDNANMIFVDGGNDRVGIGTASPSKPFEVRKDQNSNTDAQVWNNTAGTAAAAALRLKTNSSLGIITVLDDGYTSSGIYQAATLSIFAASTATGGLLLGTEGGHPINFYSNNSQQMQMDSSGRLLIGTTSNSDVNDSGLSIRADSYGLFAVKVAHRVATGDGAGIMIDLENYDGSPGQKMLEFNTAAGEVGNIKGTQSATQYNTSSDYRLKENVNYTWDATTKLKQLKPAKFNFKVSPSETVEGFLAHEVSDIVPAAISGEKDATKNLTNVVLKANGVVKASGVTEAEWTQGKIDDEYASDSTWVASHTKDIYQVIDQSKLVPLLVKTIQELEARITALEA
jgi:hypothetical protein